MTLGIMKQIYFVLLCRVFMFYYCPSECRNDDCCYTKLSVVKLNVVAPQKYKSQLKDFIKICQILLTID